MTTCNHCLGASCVHCRERRAELSLQRRRSRLTPHQRAALDLFTRPLRRRLVADRQVRRRAPVCGARRMQAVLPADFTLTGA